MENPTKILLAGIATGAVIVATGYIGLERSKSRVFELTNQCQTESKRESETIEAWRSKSLVPGLPHLSSIDTYAQWIVANKEKKGTPEFEAVARAYKMLRDGQQACDFDTLQQLQSESRLTGLQAEIFEARRGGESWLESALTFASIVTLLSAVPCAWYFLLRRVRELRDAVCGK